MYEEVQVLEHSSIRIGGEKILYFDPFHIKGEAQDADRIFITHEHYDHFSVEDIERVKKQDTVLVMPESMRGKESAVGAARVLFMKPGDVTEADNVRVEAVAAYNRLKPFHTKGKGWLGYVVTMNAAVYFVAGDTDRNEENSGVHCDVALLPVGGTYTMDAKGAAELANMIKPKCAIPTHYGSIVGTEKDADQFLERLDKNIQTRK